MTNDRQTELDGGQPVKPKSRALNVLLIVRGTKCVSLSFSGLINHPFSHQPCPPGPMVPTASDDDDVDLSHNTLHLRSRNDDEDRWRRIRA